IVKFFIRDSLSEREKRGGSGRRPLLGPGSSDALVFAFQTSKVDQEYDSWTDHHAEYHDAKD
ncbi:MAG: hypothetical protein VX032_14355, partial [SAR324 cluster bacterium]|nr:hypothetical protein [SAR324 cluster bacterium]